jgi:hypothetical protein
MPVERKYVIHHNLSFLSSLVIVVMVVPEAASSIPVTKHNSITFIPRFQLLAPLNGEQ